MSRISTVLNALKEQNRQALIPYITAGDPTKEATVPMMHALVDAGCDIIELGVPFSDPMADGPTIQLACERALVHNTSLTDVLAMVAEFRQTNADTAVGSCAFSINRSSSVSILSSMVNTEIT